jgi:hypothetical protein
MAGPLLIPVDRPEVPPRPISDRLRSQLVYFASPAGGEGMFLFDPDDVARILDEGAIALVSPLDTANRTEVELSEEQEALLEWLKANRICHARVSD